MKLQRQISRKTETRAYEKWNLTLPAEMIRELGWNAGDEIEIKLDNKRVILNKKSNTQNKGKIKTVGKKTVTFFEKFTAVYFNLPLQERRLPIVVIDEQPITWEMTYREMRHKTKLGKKIGEKLVRLEII